MIYFIAVEEKQKNLLRIEHQFKNGGSEAW